MGSRVAFHTTPGAWGSVANPFGKDVANASMFRALAQHGDFDEIGIVTHDAVTPEMIRTALLEGRESRTRFWTGNLLQPGWASRAGALIRGKADLVDTAWQRRPLGDRACSLVGIVHTIAPPAIRDYIGRSATAPIQPWDALVCTSPAVQDALIRMFAEWGEYLGSRFGVSGARTPRPHLPLVPLGVDGEKVRALADRPDVRRRRREALGLGENDLLVLWVGRLSFFEKAFPQPMIAAVEEAQRLSGIRIHFVMAGWFPNGDLGKSLYEEAAAAYARPGTVSFADGNDAALVGELWAAADVFLSLVDNIQETFGLTPLEAMAAGLPIVASDWDGYRYTMRDGQEAFLIPTLGGPPGAGRIIASRHKLGIDSYQSYVGTLAQYTAVDIGQTAQALAALARDPDLRRRMGEAGRERVRTAFDWPVVARLMRELVDELADLREKATPFEATERQVNEPLKGEPFQDFAGFASLVLGSSTSLMLRAGVDRSSLDRHATRLDKFADAWRADVPTCAVLIDKLGAAEGMKAGDLVAQMPAEHRNQVALALVWMCKIGLLEWRG